MRQLSLTDELTGLSNRRGFFVLAEQEWKVACRAKRDCVLVSLDLDGLKLVNDAFGHAEGDALLFAAAGVLKKTFRDADVIARLGGDEFAVFTRDGALDPGVVCARLQANVDAFNQLDDSRPPLS